MKKVYTFDDVCLVPQYNNINSRTEPILKTNLTNKTEIGIPLIPANMDTVISFELANILIKYGGIPIVHRFMPFEMKCVWVEKYLNNLYVSCGVKKENLEEIFNLHEKYKSQGSFRGICFDIAHGHSKIMLDAIKCFKDKLPEKEVIAGNVCTAMAFHDLAIAGANAIKCGVGDGSICLTRMVTGFGVSQFSAIRDCAEISNKLGIPLIADGGIRNSRDVILSLAAGASSVMIGKLFASVDESAAKKYKKIIDNKEYTYYHYRGQASEEFQNDYYGGVKNKTVPEGISGDVKRSNTDPTNAEELIELLLGGIRSGMTYGGARTIKELQRKAEFCEVCNAVSHFNESSTRI